jgi:hypothetical protein
VARLRSLPFSVLTINNNEIYKTPEQSFLKENPYKEAYLQVSIPRKTQ